MHAQLVPQPQRMHATGGVLSLTINPTIRLAGQAPGLLFAAQWLQRGLDRHGISAHITAAPLGDAAIVLAIDPALLGAAQSYKLQVSNSGIFAVGKDAAGAFYAVCTLIQLVDASGQDGAVKLEGVHIHDWPDFPNRGVMLDVCRDRVPTMETLYALVDMLAGLKVNQLQLYIEHTFAYHGHEEVWQYASPLTGDEIFALDVYCRARFIELVPNQNSFGHMHRWLKHEKYRHLAECPEGIEHPFTPIKEPYSLCPTDPGSIDLLADLYGQLLPHFTSKQFNVGLDETFDLGKGRSKAESAAKGTGQVYMEFLLKVHRLVTQHGHTMQFWSDILTRDEPALVAELPRDVIALEWGYDAAYPFAKHATMIEAAGRSFYVCPGTGSWSALAGRTANAIGNTANAAINGHAHGAIGYLNTDWGDHGHMQPPPVSYLGFMTGAAFAWNAGSAGEPDNLDVAALLDLHVFRDRAGVMGRLVYDLGNTYMELDPLASNSSTLFWLATIPYGVPAQRQPKGLSQEGLERSLAHIDWAMAPMGTAELWRRDARLIQAEFSWVADMLRWACRVGMARVRAGLDRPVSAIDTPARAELAAELEPLIQRYRELWLQRSRPGGLADSAARLETMLAQLQL